MVLGNTLYQTLFHTAVRLPLKLAPDVLPRLLQARHAQGELVQVAVQKQSLPVVIVLHHGVAAEQPIRTFDALTIRRQHNLPSARPPKQANTSQTFQQPSK